MSLLYEVLDEPSVTVDDLGHKSHGKAKIK